MYEKMKADLLPELIPVNAKILVAVSGGPDSVALSHLVWRYVREYPSRENSLVLTHIHHGVRKESDEEEELVRSLAQRWKIPCLVHRFRAKEYAESCGESFQTAARKWRYQRWQEDMMREQCDLLATAHHLGDQAETVLYRLLRGSGTAGLAGMYPVKDRIIRPLLGFSKAEILAYCEQENLPYALDYSNKHPVYVRNRIRLELLPKLEADYNPQIQQALGRLAGLMRWDEEYLQQQTELAWPKYSLPAAMGCVGLRKEAWEEPPAILTRLIRKAASLITREPRGIAFQFVENIMRYGGIPGWSQDLHGLRVIADKEGIWFKQPGSPENPEAFRNESSDVELKYNSWTAIPEWGMEAGLFEDFLNNYLEGSGKALIDKDGVWYTYLNKTETTGVKLVCRKRQAGDKIFIRGLGHKELKKVFQEAGIKAKERRNLPLIASGNEVIWIPGIRRSGLFCPVSEEEKILCILRKV